MSAFIDFSNTIIWDYILIYLIGGAGLYFTFRSRFIQLRLFRHSASLLWQGREHKAGQISSFQAFTTSMAARVGTGNIGGVAVALYVGGPGAIFWMWVIALIGMYQATGEVEYLEEVNTLLGFLKERLLIDGQILHHWIDGRAAADPDPYIYCLGCNVQTLYLLLVLQMTLAP